MDCTSQVNSTWEGKLIFWVNWVFTTLYSLWGQSNDFLAGHSKRKQPLSFFFFQRIQISSLWYSDWFNVNDSCVNMRFIHYISRAVHAVFSLMWISYFPQIIWYFMDSVFFLNESRRLFKLYCKLLVEDFLEPISSLVVWFWKWTFYYVILCIIF